MEHLRPLLHEARGLELYSELCSRLAQAKVPPPVIDMLRAGRLTALAKPDGGVRGIVAGYVIRRLVARTMAHQKAEIVERATAPHQYALSTKRGCECVAHVLQGLRSCVEGPTTGGRHRASVFVHVLRVPIGVPVTRQRGRGPRDSTG